MNKVEVLSPAGSLEKLKIAVMYGADAVYIGGEAFSLRVAAENFSNDDIKSGIDFAHKHGAKVYVAANIIAHNKDIGIFEDFIKELSTYDIDGIIVADMGMFSLVKKFAPSIEIHVSTQANVTNYEAANMWYQLGAKRIVLARELSLEEIRQICKNTPDDLDIEVFVHGAMCISYSGRCLLSNYMSSRDANQGNCAQSCRWKYNLVEEMRPNEYMPIYETERGTFIYNSKDLCLIEHVNELIEAGVTSLKIEGRVKTEYYVAVVTKAYREAVDSYLTSPKDYKFDPKLYEELQKISHRLYTKGFYEKKPDGDGQIYTSSSYIRSYDVVAIVGSFNKQTNIATLKQRNRFFEGDEIEIIQPAKPFFTQKVVGMTDENGEKVENANHAEMVLKLKLDNPVVEGAILRKVRLKD